MRMYILNESKIFYHLRDKSVFCGLRINNLEIWNCFVAGNPKNWRHQFSNWNCFDKRFWCEPIKNPTFSGIFYFPETWSNLLILRYLQKLRCFWCQRYKIWKELTTVLGAGKREVGLFLMSKIQDLKGTHNDAMLQYNNNRVVSDVKDTRFERNSQHIQYQSDWT